MIKVESHWPDQGITSRRPLVAAALLAVGLWTSATAQEIAPLETDRPDLTESALVVPQGSVQLESGLTYENSSDGARLLSGPEILLRWGFARRTELRVGLPDYIRQRRTGRAAGFGDTYLGFKYQFGPLPGGFELAAIPAVFLPSGADEFTSGGVDPEVVFPWAKDLTERTSLGGQFGLHYPRANGGRDFTWTATLVYGYALTDRWRTFMEYAGEFPAAGDDIHLLHHGYTYSLTRLSQLDFHLGMGISHAAPDFFIGAGYSVRF